MWWTRFLFVLGGISSLFFVSTAKADNLSDSFAPIAGPVWSMDSREQYYQKNMEVEVPFQTQLKRFQTRVQKSGRSEVYKIIRRNEPFPPTLAGEIFDHCIDQKRDLGNFVVCVNQQINNSFESPEMSLLMTGPNRAQCRSKLVAFFDVMFLLEDLSIEFDTYTFDWKEENGEVISHIVPVIHMPSRGIKWVTDPGLLPDTIFPFDEESASRLPAALEQPVR